jgi:hypothetical protein
VGSRLVQFPGRWASLVNHGSQVLGLDRLGQPAHPSLFRGCTDLSGYIAGNQADRYLVSDTATKGGNGCEAVLSTRQSVVSDHEIGFEMIASSDHHLERMIVTREDGEAVWAERRLDQAAWAFVRPVRSAFQFHGSRQSS